MAILYCFLNSEVQEVIKRRLIQRFLTNRDINRTTEGLEMQYISERKRTQEEATTAKIVEMNISVTEQPQSMKTMAEQEQVNGPAAAKMQCRVELNIN